MYNVMVMKDARRRHRGMPNNTARTIIGKIDALAAGPFAPNSNVTALKAIAGFRLRVGDWRVLYTVNKGAETLTIAAIVPLGEAYR